MLLLRIRTESGCQCGPTLEHRQRGSKSETSLRNIMRKILTLTIAIMAGAALSANAADAKATYEKDCAKCHGKDGKGQTVTGKKQGAKDYTDPKVQAELKDEDAVKAIKEGYKNKDGKEVMKPAEGLSDEEIKGLVAYMRKFKK